MDQRILMANNLFAHFSALLHSWTFYYTTISGELEAVQQQFNIHSSHELMANSLRWIDDQLD